MSSLTFLEYDKILKDSNYDLEPKELEILTYRLSLFITPQTVKNKILNDLKDLLTTKYNIRVDTDESELIIDFGLSQLSFGINDDMLLILTEEQWYNSCEAHDIVIGEPSAHIIIYVVNIFRNEGRDDSRGNPSMADLLKDSSS